MDSASHPKPLESVHVPDPASMSRYNGSDSRWTLVDLFLDPFLQELGPEQPTVRQDIDLNALCLICLIVIPSTDPILGHHVEALHTQQGHLENKQHGHKVRISCNYQHSELHN